MSQPRSNAALVAFEHPVLGSAAEEFKALPPEVALPFLSHLDKVAFGRLDHWTLKEFDNYRGIPFYKATIDRWFVIYAVEEQNLGDRKVTVMLSGQGVPPFDGLALQRRVRDRAEVWFV